MATPSRRAEDLEKKFAKLKAAADPDDPKAQKELINLGREAAEVLLSAGKMERAAEICRDAGLIDQAVNLYVNLLGRPGDAAVLLASNGEHQRAAELFEAAGEKQRALACWLDCSFEAKDPLEHLPEVEQRLGQRAAISMLDTIVRKRPPTKKNLDLHVRIAKEYEERDQSGPAITVLQEIDRIKPRYLDVPERLGRLRTGTPQVPPAPWELEQKGQDGRVRSPAEEEIDLAGGGESGPILDMGGGGGNMSDADSNALLSQLEPHAWSPETIHAIDPDENEESSEDEAPDKKSGGLGELEISELMAGRADGVEEGADDVTPLYDPPDPVRRPSMLEEHDFGLNEKTPLHRASSAARRMGLEDAAQPPPSDPLIGPSVEEMVNRAAEKAVEEAVSRARSQMIVMDPTGANVQLASQGRGRTRPMRLGFEEKVVTLRFARDHAVREAVSGSDLKLLADKLQDQQPKTGNLEHFFRLGLAMVNSGRWLEARNIFDAVHRARPDYLDAGDRADELGNWEKAVKRTVAEQGDFGSELLERYKMMGEIGRGGMAVVYRARDLSLDRDVALKFMAESMTKDKTMADLFRREAKAAARLNHPNIVTIYDFGTLGERAFICMELVGGETVEEILIRDGRLATLDALAIAEDILRALEYAHSEQIIHRDIKPSNVMRNERGECKLMDFGLAKSGSDGGKTTMVAGTPIYMAPEQFTGRNVDALSDIFALGATLYEMIAGVPPFESVARNAAPPSLRVRCPKVPSLLDNLILRALEFDKTKRVQSAREMLEPIQYILNTVRSYLRTSGKVSSPTGSKAPSASPSPPGPTDGKVTQAFGSRDKGID